MEVNLTGADRSRLAIEGELAELQEKIALLSEQRSETGIQISQLLKERDRLFRHLAHLSRTAGDLEELSAS